MNATLENFNVPTELFPQKNTQKITAQPPRRILPVTPKNRRIHSPAYHTHSTHKQNTIYTNTQTVTQIHKIVYMIMAKNRTHTENDMCLFADSTLNASLKNWLKTPKNGVFSLKTSKYWPFSAVFSLFLHKTSVEAE